MEHFLINSSVCLFVLWLAYKLLLENTSWHFFKRYYLISVVIISLVIPFIVVETIVIPIEEIPFRDYGNLVMEEPIVSEPGFSIKWFYVFPSIYAIGFLIMLWRFGKNLNSFRIQQEDEVSSYKAYQLILRNSITIPHSFLKRIFIAKKDYESNKVPAVVLEHEKAHLDQKHSLDILLIEMLIVVLWFNPLLYIIRYAMKLNHEFLADCAVLSQGISTSDYQEILLEQATASYQQAMANTFTFPIIKKRFTIMKTQTSTTSLVLRSLALIPVLALLIISCGKEETEFEEVVELPIVFEVVEDAENQKMIVVDPTDPKGTIMINDELHTYVIKGDKIDIYNKDGALQDFESQGYEVKKVAEIIEVVEVLENLTEKHIEEYNRLAKKHEQYMKLYDQLIVWENETTHMQTIFNSMSKEQQENNEPWPYLNATNNVRAGQIPPPPPPPPAAPTKSPGYIKVDDKIYRYTLKENDNNFYDRNGNIIDVYGKTVEYVNQEDLPPPPPPADPLDYIKSKGDDMNYYIDDVKVNAEQAKAFIKKNGNKGIQVGFVNGVYSLRMKSPQDKRVGIKNGSWKDVKYFVQEETATTKSTLQYDSDFKIAVREKDTISYIKGEDGEWEEIQITLTDTGKRLSFDLNNIQPLAPSAQDIKSWQDSSKYALWIDGAVAENSDLNNYDFTDFTHHITSKVYKNARSDRFPQPYQVSIYTEDGFKKSYRSKG